MTTLKLASGTGTLVIRELTDPAVLRDRSGDTDLWTLPGEESDRYVVGFAASDRCIELALRLRYEVFNLELNEGLPTSHMTGLDRDAFDAQMTHLVVLDRSTGAVVGTYRMQTGLQAMASGGGLYSAQEYDLTDLRPYFDQIVECGRACIAREHRSVAVLAMLWRGLGAFCQHHRQRWLFGCCSLTSQDPDDGWRALKTIRANGYLHESLFLPARPAMSCGSVSREFDPDLGPAIKLPKLFAAYMRLGVKVISEPAIDREFRTVDFLILFDSTRANVKTLLTGMTPQPLSRLLGL
jgi:putative hemolysin